MKSYDMTIQIKPPQQCFQMGLFVLQNFTNLMKSWIFAHFLLWSFLRLKKLTDSTFVFKLGRIYIFLLIPVLSLWKVVRNSTSLSLFFTKISWIGGDLFGFATNTCKINIIPRVTACKCKHILICLRLQAIGKVTFNVALPIEFNETGTLHSN